MEDKATEQSPWVGIVGASVFLAMMILKIFIFPNLQVAINENDYLLLTLTLQVAVMCSLEILINKVYQKHFRFSRDFCLNFSNWKNIFARWFALIFLLALAGLIYVFFSDSSLNSPLLFRYFCTFTASFALLGLPYFYCYEKFCIHKQPEELLSLFSLLSQPHSWLTGKLPLQKYLADFFRFLLVKCFFLPVMLASLSFNAQAFEQYFAHAFRFLIDTNWYNADSQSWNFAIHSCYGILLYLIFLMDVSLATIGYSLSCKFLDNHVRSTDSVFLGWSIALVCYWPFQALVNNSLCFHLSENSVYFSKQPVLSAVMAIMTLALFSIYLLATCMFGLRFSNLTHRGIIITGPYAIVRHPAYIAKNLALWIICLPTILSWRQTNVKRCAFGLLALALWASIYTLRAYTEEWHLNDDEQYLRYRAKVKWMFVPCLW